MLSCLYLDLCTLFEKVSSHNINTKHRIQFKRSSCRTLSIGVRSLYNFFIRVLFGVSLSFFVFTFVVFGSSLCSKSVSEWESNQHHPTRYLCNVDFTQKHSSLPRPQNVMTQSVRRSGRVGVSVKKKRDLNSLC